MTNLEQLLNRLALSFTVQDIMVRKEDLLCASNETSAQKELKVNPAFDVIPIERNSRICSYLERGAKSPKNINLKDIISDATSTLDLVDVLSNKKFCFVLSGNDLRGYVHFSDLNKQIVKLPLFVIFEALENYIIKEIRLLINENNLDKVLDSQRISNLKDKMRKLRKNRADLGWVNLLYFKERILFARYFEKIKLKVKEIDTMSSFRNLICHAGGPLVESHQSVSCLSDIKKKCITILEEGIKLPNQSVQ
jgi:hypothetical protein